MDFFTRGDIQQSVKRMDELLACGIFTPQSSGHVLFRAAFIELLITLRDLMAKCRKFAEPIRFDDDVLKIDGVEHVSDLIKHVRDAICHPDSENHFMEGGTIKSSFNVAFGKVVLIQTDTVTQESKYEDDICFFFGTQAIYLHRHIVRALDEAKAKLLPLVAAADPRRAIHR